MVVRPVRVRQFLITRAHVERFGATEGCPKCRAIVNGAETQPTRAHNQVCRTRMERLLQENPKLRLRVAASDRRRDEYLAGEVERGVRRKVQGPGRVPEAGEHDGEPADEAMIPMPGSSTDPVPGGEADV